MPGIGESLREARLNRGLTHEYISQIIKIRPEFLVALEEEDLAALPGNFYAKNFLRRYADFLNLDSGALVERWVMQENAAAGQPSIAYPNPPAATGAPETRRHWRPNFGLAAMLAVLVIGALALGARAFLVSPAREAGDGLSATATPSAITVALVPTPTTEPTPPTAPPVRPTAVVQAPAVTAKATATRRPQAQRPLPTATKRPAVQAARPRATATTRPDPTRAPRPKPTRTPRPEPTNTPRPKPTNTPRPTATPEPTNTPVPEPTNTPTPEPTNTPMPEPTNTPVPEVEGEVVGTIRTTATSSVTVKSDGRTVFQGEIEPGETERFGANANLYIYSNSAQNVLVSVNDCIIRTLDAYGCPGCQVAYYNFPRTYTDCR